MRPGSARAALVSRHRLARAVAAAARAARAAAREGRQARVRTLRITPRGQVAVRSGFERCDPAERLEEPARVRGSRAGRTRRVKMFACRDLPQHVETSVDRSRVVRGRFECGQRLGRAGWDDIEVEPLCALVRAALRACSGARRYRRVLPLDSLKEWYHLKPNKMFIFFLLG